MFCRAAQFYLRVLQKKVQKMMEENKGGRPRKTGRKKKVERRSVYLGEQNNPVRRIVDALEHQNPKFNFSKYISFLILKDAKNKFNDFLQFKIEDKVMEALYFKRIAAQNKQQETIILNDLISSGVTESEIEDIMMRLSK